MSKPIPEPDSTAGFETARAQERWLELDQSTFVRLLVRQQGVDVALRFSGPGLDEEIVADNPTGSHDSEELVAITPADGRYRLAVEPVGDRAGSYRVEAFGARPARPEDRRYVRAGEIFLQARRLSRSGQASEALVALEPLVAEWGALGAPLRGAWTHYEIAKAKRALGRSRDALDHFEQVIAVGRQLGERRLLANSLLMAATLDLHLGRADRTLDRLEEALPLFLEFDHQRGVVGALAKIGVAHLHQGRPHDAIESLSQALSLAEDRDRASILNDLGGAALTLHRVEEALEHFGQAAIVAREAENVQELSVALGGVGRAAARLGEHARAESAITEALESPGIAVDFALRLRLSLGFVQRLSGDLDAAHGTFEQAFFLAEKLERIEPQAEALLNLGYLEIVRGDPTSGLDLCERAFELFQRIHQDRGKASASARAAEALLALDRRQEAWAHLDKALAEVETLRRKARRADHRLSFFAFRQDYFDIGRRLLLHGLASNDLMEPELAKAFDLEERRRARELFERVSRGSRDPTDVDAAELKREKRLVTQLHSAVAAGELERVESLVGELHSVRSAIEQHPLTDLAQVSLDVVRQEILDSESLLLIVGLGEEEGVLWSVHREGVDVFPLPARREIDELARALVKNVRSVNHRARHRADEVAGKLAKHLLEPVSERLSSTRRLILVLDGELQTAPLAMLPSSTDKAESQFLIESHELVLLPSVSLLSPRSDVAQDGMKQRFAVFTDPAFGRGDSRLASLEQGETETYASSRRRRALERSLDDLISGGPPDRLPASQREADRILELAGDGDHFFASGLEARRETFLELDYSRYSHLHVATHALMHSEPALSGLVFSRFDRAGRESPEHGFVAGFDIVRLKMPLELVVLSACETGTSERIVRGEGSMSLAWSFLAAGARRVVASLWRVHDEPTAELMSRFYEAHLGKGMTPAAALREAQLATLRRDGSRPRDWAGFVIQGDWR